MLFASLFKVVAVVGALSLLLVILASNLLGPGLSDYSETIVNGYSYDDAGHFEKTIVFTNSQGRSKIVVDARVDDYVVDGDTLVVARRPREVYREGDVTKSRLSISCEFLLVDTVTHTVTAVAKPAEMNCK